VRKNRFLGLAVGSVAATASAAAPAALATQPASANFGSSPGGGSPHNEVSLANNKWHIYSYHNAPSAWRTALDDAVFWSYQPTDLVLSKYADGSNNVDVRVDVGNHGTGAFGWVYCPTDGIRSGTDPNESCFGQWLKIDTGTATGLDADGRKAVMCHEFGHTVGLLHANGEAHSGDTCISTFPDFGFDDTGLHQHDIDHINSEY